MPLTQLLFFFIEDEEQRGAGERNPRTMPSRAAARPGRGIRGTRIPRGMARILRGLFCEFAGTITIVRNSAQFRAIWSADLRVRARI